MSIPLAYDEPGYAAHVQSLEARARVICPPLPSLSRVALGAAALGTLAFLVGIYLAPGRAWGALDASFLFWVGLSQAGVISCAVFNTGWAKWGRNVQRLIEPLGAFMLFTPAVYLVLWLGRRHIYFWTTEAHRSPWLNSVGMLLRDELILVTMAALSLWWLYCSFRPDMKQAQGGIPGDRFVSWLTTGWKGTAQEVERNQAVLRNLGPVFIIAYCWGFSVLDIDLGMVIAPGFKSTMFPGIYWAAEYLAAIALGAVLVWLWRRWSPLARDIITGSNIQDLSNLVWAFAIFRTWFDWSQYIIVWYGNLPDESGYLIDRWRIHPWNYLAYLSLFFIFIAPFFYGFSRRLKRHPVGSAVLGGMVFTGALARQFMDVMPSVHPLQGLDFGLIELCIAIGFGGAVALPYLWLLARVPLFPVSDPLFRQCLETRGIPET